METWDPLSQRMDETMVFVEQFFLLDRGLVMDLKVIFINIASRKSTLYFLTKGVNAIGSLDNLASKSRIL